MVTKAKPGKDRKAELLIVGAKLVAKVGAENLTRRAVAKAAKVSEPLVTHYFGSTVDLRKACANYCKRIGWSQPDKKQVAAVGQKLRAHKVERTPRKRSIAEVKAIKRKLTSIAPPPGAES